MTNETPATGPTSQTSQTAQTGGKTAARRTHPLLAQLAQWHPGLFGQTPQPLKRGIYDDLLALHAAELKAEELGQALAIHTRSTRYLSAVAQGLPRRDLQGQAVEAPAPEHIYQALLEVFRRRQQRSAEDLGPKLRRRIAQAWQASGLTRDDYAQAMHSKKNEQANAVLQAALEEAVAQMAKDEALLRAFEASAQSETDFAQMYGLHPREAARALARARQQRSRV